MASADDLFTVESLEYFAETFHAFERVLYEELHGLQPGVEEAFQQVAKEYVTLRGDAIRQVQFAAASSTTARLAALASARRAEVAEAEQWRTVTLGLLDGKTLREIPVGPCGPRPDPYACQIIFCSWAIEWAAMRVNAWLAGPHLTRVPPKRLASGLQLDEAVRRIRDRRSWVFRLANVEPLFHFDDFLLCDAGYFPESAILARLDKVEKAEIEASLGVSTASLRLTSLVACGGLVLVEHMPADFERQARIPRDCYVHDLYAPAAVYCRVVIDEGAKHWLRTQGANGVSVDDASAFQNTANALVHVQPGAQEPSPEETLDLIHRTFDFIEGLFGTGLSLVWSRPED